MSSASLVALHVSIPSHRQSFEPMMSDRAAGTRKTIVAEPVEEAGKKKPMASGRVEGSDASEDDGGAGDGDRDSRGKQQNVVTHNERWEDAFSRLKAFQRRHGHCEVPFRYAPDTRLGRWGTLCIDTPNDRSPLSSA